MILSIVLLWIKYATIFYDLSVHLAFIIIYFAMIIKFAPMENENKPLGDFQKNKRKNMFDLWCYTNHNFHDFMVWF